MASDEQTTDVVSLRRWADVAEDDGDLPEAKLLRRAADEIERLREDNRLLACAALGITPDHNTQTDAEATETAIFEAARRALPQGVEP